MKQGEAKRQAQEHSVVLGAYVALTALMTYPLIGQFGQAIPGDGFDGWQNYWNLWWVKQALVEKGTNPFFTDMLYYPTGVSLAFHTLNIFNGLFTLPVQLLFGLFPAYNTAVYFSFVAGAFGAYLLARHVLRRAGWQGGLVLWPAILAGVVYAYSPFHFAHLLGHMQVFSLEWLPFAVLALVGGFDRLERGATLNSMIRGAGAAALALILAGLCDWYNALYMGLFTVLLVLYRLCAGAMRWCHVGLLALAWGLFLVILSPLWYPMVQQAGQATFMFSSEEQARLLSADLLAFVTPSEFHPLWGQAMQRFASRFTSTTSERTVFAGFVPLALAIIAVGKLERKSRFWWIATGAFVLCALGPVLHIGGCSEFTPAAITVPLPYMLLYRTIPFLRIARSISRFDVMVMLSLSVLAALGLAYVIHQGQKLWGRGRRALHAVGTPRATHPWMVGLPAVILVCFEFLSVPYPFSPPDTPAFYEEIAQEPGEFAVLNLPMNWDRPGYLLYQTVHGKPISGGYISRDDPRTLVYRAPILQEFRYLGPDILCDDLRRLGPSVLDWLNVRYVILDHYKMPGGEEREVTIRLAEELFAGVQPVYADERLIVYRVEPPNHRLPFAILGEGWGPREADGKEIWRAIEGRAGLWIQAEAGRPIRLMVHARGPAGGMLTLREEQGAHTRVTLSPTGVEAVLDWRPAHTPAQVELLVEGAGLCRVSRVQVQYG